MFRLIPVMDQTHLSFQRGQEAWLAEFEKWWGRNNEAALVVRPTLRVQSNAEITARAWAEKGLLADKIFYSISFHKFFVSY